MHGMHSLLFFFGYPRRAATEFYNGTLKLRYFSTPFSKPFPTWSVAHHSSGSPMVGPSPGFSVHFPDHDPVDQRLEKRSRITGKSSAHKRSLEDLGELPTLKRWKKVDPQRICATKG